MQRQKTMDGITILSAFPFALHVFTAIGIIFDMTTFGSKDEIISYWIEASVNCFSITPATWSSSHYLAYAQACLAVAAFLAHASSQLHVRKIGYGILLLMYIVTQLRHIIWGHGTEVISYLYTHIAIFSTLVLYNDSFLPRNKKNL